MTNTWPLVAYHFHLNETVTIEDAIKMRTNGDNRAGDIWCHAECYKAYPREGNQLLPVNRQSCPHFRGPRARNTKKSSCNLKKIWRRKSETYRFGQLYHDLLRWLKNGDEGEKPREMFHISEIKESRSKHYDILIEHSENDSFERRETRVLIIDKNRKRTPESEITMIIDISEWRDEDLAKFDVSGKRKFIDEWDQLEAENTIETQSNEQMSEVERWIMDHKPSVLLAKAVIRHEKANSEYYSEIRDGMVVSLDYNSDSRQDEFFEKEEAIRQINRRKPILGMRMIEVARKIVAQREARAKRIRLGYYSYSFTDLEELSKKFQDENNDIEEE